MYETAIMTYDQMAKFIASFDEKVGVDREVNKVDLNQYYVFCVDLETPEEIQMCRNIETYATMEVK